MKFTLAQTFPASLTFTAETTAESVEIVKHFRLDTLSCINGIQSGNLTHCAVPSNRDHSSWFAVSHQLGREWVAPYFAKLASITGWDGADMPTIPAPRYPGGYCVNLCHTHIVESATIDASGYAAAGFVSCGDWNGATGQDRAPRLFAEYLTESLGHRPSEPEFIEVGNGGLLRRNPNYLRRRPVQPRLTSAPLFDCLWQHWLTHHATSGQRDIAEKADALHRGVCRNDSQASFLIRSYDNGFRLAWDAPIVEYRGLLAPSRGSRIFTCEGCMMTFAEIQEQMRADRTNGVHRISARMVRLAVRPSVFGFFVAAMVQDLRYYPVLDSDGETWIWGACVISTKGGAL
jgi:hypothetical protein